jgi:NiFe hydrogenase small subunit HydA
MELSRRDFLKASSAVTTAIGLSASGILKLEEALAAPNAPSVVWLEGQACSGCSVSLLNTIYYSTIDNLLLNTIDLEYHATVMASAGDMAVGAAQATYNKGGYILVVEGSVPTGSSGAYGSVWKGMTIQQAVTQYAAKAAYIVAVGSCAAFGGVPGAKPNPTTAQSLRAILPGKTVVNLPGCPAHPDWVVGTIAYILKNGKAPTLDSNGRPTDFFGKRVHDTCLNLSLFNSTYGRYMQHSGGRPCTACHGSNMLDGGTLGRTGCLFAAGCKGPSTYADCASRKWNGGAASTPGVNWCITAGSPCIGCTEPTFPDRMSPFYTLGNVSTGSTGGSTGGSRGERDNDDDDDERERSTATPRTGTRRHYTRRRENDD